jgi:hypothetical protein
MSMISAIDSNKVHQALAEHLDKLGPIPSNPQKWPTSHFPCFSDFQNGKRKSSLFLTR